ncbi:FKBP-type peptidyl-prolyl cis-trans isomerase [Sediminibacterium goheungense]|uniref:Peptidyl-prolyl cis-trans isomerase n=1 Tax=Sediminibacterium goheungense TaxID=1086393 RepID=A0A4R6IND4_9BACT|nr:FKBP-type peptidyl-prolyl cis-trans isomerase [Sediminibacterium goheungense]TDO23611.1 FKBP-type peptidyl-prolyl cis-trans isomerase [Sediminibacterium goheungense]
MRTTTSLLLAIVLLASCNQYEKAPSGMTYKISGNSKEKLKHGQFVKMHIEYKLKSKDTLLQSSFDNIPVYFAVDTGRLGKHTFTEIITLCGAGDKVDFVLSIDTLKSMQVMDYNDMFKKGDLINGHFEILKVFANQDEVKADYDKELVLEKQREINAVKEYVKKKKLNVQSTPSGLQVEVQNAGTGQKADSGWQAVVRYKGYFIGKTNEGKVFETNMDPNAQPINVEVGTGSVMPGWDEGLRMFGKGGKGRLIIPAALAYGTQGSAPVIPPFANLAFDIEVVDVVKAAPKPANPEMPQQMPQQMPRQ